MEDDGICLDVDYVNRLDAKYEKGLNEASIKMNEILAPYENELKRYRMLGQLDDPINYESPIQLKIVLYDVLKIKPLDEKQSTDKNALKAIDHPFTKALLAYRHYSILMKTFTKALPGWLSQKDGRLHAKFNQMGTEDNNVRTGRFSSTNPKQINWGLYW